MTLPVLDDEPKKPTFFDLLTILETTKTPWLELTEDQQKAYNPYMINRFVSSKEIYTQAVAQIDTMKLTPAQHYAIMCDLISNTRRNYFDYKAYKKKEKTSKTDNTDLILYAIEREYEIGKKEAKYYMSQIPEEVLDKLATKWEDAYKAK